MHKHAGLPASGNINKFAEKENWHAIAQTQTKRSSTEQKRECFQDVGRYLIGYIPLGMRSVAIYNVPLTESRFVARVFSSEQHGVRKEGDDAALRRGVS